MSPVLPLSMYMMSDTYLKYVADVDSKKKKSKSKKRKVTTSPLRVGESSTPAFEVGTPVVVLSPSSSPPPTTPAPSAPRPARTGNVVFLEPGELWSKGVTKSLMAAVRPPKEYEDSSTMTPEMITTIRRHQEDGMKAFSLLSSFAEMAISQESSQAALHLRESNAEKAVKEAEKAVKESEKLMQAAEKLAKDKAQKLDEANEEVAHLKTSVESLNAKIADLENKAVVSDMSAELALRGKFKELKAEYKKVKHMLRQAVIHSFNNAISQAKILNSGLVMEGMGYQNVVREGKIVPYSSTVTSQASSAPSQDESDGSEEEGGEDEEEDTEVADAEVGDATPKE